MNALFQMNCRRMQALLKQLNIFLIFRLISISFIDTPTHAFRPTLWATSIVNALAHSVGSSAGKTINNN